MSLDTRAPPTIGIETPTWDDQILSYFTKPYWIAPETRSIEVARGWVQAMEGYFITLDDYNSVKSWSTLIYQHLHSRAMPLTSDISQLWPNAAMETFRIWVNQGWRKTASDPIDEADRIPRPVDPVRPLKLRRDILSLSQAELDDYRMRLEDVFRVEDASVDAPGQVFFSIHGNWCLHYQEAFLLWHRAYLMAFEQRLGCAAPYWNWYAADASVDGSPSAGLPQAFKDETYIRPDTREVRPNPLRYAAAMGGVSKACAPTSNPAPASCYWVQRDPVLYSTGDDQRLARTRKYGLTLQYQLQVQRALAFNKFSHPQGIGYPWANIPTFDPPPPDSDYVYRNYNFDGAYEQPHDNYHGWVGPDMADNAYTAFDPVFWSYHSNIDRIFELWLRDNSATATFTANFPLRPFARAFAESLEFTDPRVFVYTTIGDLAKDCRGLGYDYAAPACPDFGSTPSQGKAAASRSRIASLDAAKRLTPAVVPEDELLIVFDNVRCTFDSYAIDAFLDFAAPTLKDVDPANDHYVGRFSRIGMGVADDKGRCVAVGPPRILDATATARRLGLKPGGEATLSLLVTDLASGTPIAADAQANLPGFAGRLVWSKYGVVTRQLAAPATTTPSCRH